MWLRRLVLLSCGLLVLVTAIVDVISSKDRDFELSGPYTHKNLSIFLVHGDERTDPEILITLAEALKMDKIAVHEKGDVQELEVECKSDAPVFIQSGCMVKGGRQDRVLRYDMVVAPKSGRQPIKAFCIEQGRWSQRGDENVKEFKAVPGIVGSKKIKAAATISESQADVWMEVDSLQKQFQNYIRSGRASDVDYLTSLPLAMEDREVKAKINEYMETLNPYIINQNDAIGVVVAINGEISCGDFYRSSVLFSKMRNALIEATAVEAAAAFRDSLNTKSLDKSEVLKWLESAEEGEPNVVKINDSMTLKIIETDKSVTFESFYGTTHQEWIHKNVLSR